MTEKPEKTEGAPPPPSTHVPAQFLPTEDGEFNGNVGELIVPPHCSGYSFIFEPGVLHVKKDGSGYIVVNEDDFVLEDDRCEGPDGPEGSVHWITRMDVSEIAALRDFLNGAPQAHTVARGTPEYAAAEAAFTEYFVRNYPGPDTIIFDPRWHAPKLFAAAVQAVREAR